MDVATAVVVTGLIGEYWKHVIRLFKTLRSRNWLSARRVSILLIFPVLVVGGVAGEFWVNLRVSQLENEWEISQLPRDLREDQKHKISSAIRQFPGMHFDLAVQNDLEPMKLLDKIEDAVVAAGWIEQPPPTAWGRFNRSNRSAVGEKTVAGVWVLHSVRSDPAVGDAAKALIEALRGERIATSDMTINPGDETDLGVVHIWVGGKPQA
jgi:hypothetical protein